MGRPKKYNTEEERKAAHREADKRWRENNKDKIHEYRQNNKEKIAEYQAEYRSSHKDEKAAYATEYYQQHMDKIAEYNAEYYLKNKEKITEYNAEYRSTPKGRANHLLIGYKQKDKKYNRGECTLTADWIVKNIFSQRCHYCGETDWMKLGCDRIDNTKPHTPDNVVPCCKACNDKKHTTPYEEYLEQIDKSDTD